MIEQRLSDALAGCVAAAAHLERELSEKQNIAQMREEQADRWRREAGRMVERVQELEAGQAHAVVDLGLGKVGVSAGAYSDKPALIFSRGGSGVVGEDMGWKPGDVIEPEDLLAVVTFGNVESLDVVIENLLEVRKFVAGRKPLPELPKGNDHIPKDGRSG